MPNPTSVLAFSYIVALIPSLLLYAVFYSSRKQGLKIKRRVGLTFLSVGLVFFVTAVIVDSGVLEMNPWPALPAFLLLNFCVSLLLVFSPIGELLAKSLPLSALVAFQGFRLPLELILHSWARQGTIPASMTWTGSNFDIFTGLAAFAIAPFADRKPQMAWAFNFFGLFQLCNVARVAILSSPLPFAWPVEPHLRLAFYLPYAFIIPFCVFGALAAHGILFRALLNKKAAR